MRTTLDRLEALRNQPTRYELIAEKDGVRVLISYCMRQGRHVLLKECQRHGEKLVAIMGLGESAKIVFLKPAKLGARIGDWSVRFSGRTQREAVGSELPWIGDIDE